MALSWRSKPPPVDLVKGAAELDKPDVPRLTDPRTSQDYALLPERRYERFKSFFEEDPITIEEQKIMLREFGKRAGWDDPEWDEFDEMMKRESL